MSMPVWAPSKKTATGSQMRGFLDFVAGHYAPHVNDYAGLYEWSVTEREQFWMALWRFADIKASRLWDDVYVPGGELFSGRWFTGSRLNFAENLLRYCTAAHAQKAALVFWGEDRVKRTITYAELQTAVTRLASALRGAGVERGDRVAGFMPNMPETVVAMLAATSLGAVWSSCSPDFGFHGVMDRFGQIEPKVLFTADGYYFKGKPIDSLATAKRVAASIDSIRRVVVVPYIGAESLADIRGGCWYQDFVSGAAHEPLTFAQLPFNHPLYIMYSSGTTGVPKCIVHGAGGTLLQHRKEHMLHTDISENDVFFYFTTCGWMMWNWLVSGLASGATLLLYDGSPFYPQPQTLIDFAQDTGMTVFGTSAKYLSALEKEGVKPGRSHDLETLRCVLSTGSPLAPESYDYLYRDWKSDLHIASISGGTDIISCFALGNPLLPVYRGELQCRGLGMKVEVFNDEGEAVQEEKGELVCSAPFPSMPIYFWKDERNEKYRAAYFSHFPGVWSHGDYAELTEHGGLIIYGRSDAVLNPGGVRIGTAEIYRQVEKLPEVLESIAVGQQWENDVRVILFVRLREGVELNDELVGRIRKTIRDNTTPRHVPAKIIAVPEIPRTISGKIVELAVANVIHGREVKNVDALANPQALAYFKDRTELRE